MKSYLETVNYSSCNEDSASEIKSLRISEKDRILCITGSGARPLDLLIKKPKEIVSIDFNACQSYLLELKMKAIKFLEYEDFLDFLGVTPSVRRREWYKIIRNSLDRDSRIYWDRNFSMIKKGVIYQGRWEKYFRSLARMVRLLRPHLREELFTCKSIEEQANIWTNQWNNAVWRFFLKVISSRFTWKYFFGDPGFYANVSRDFSIYEYLQEKLIWGFDHIKASDSPFLNILFFGKFKADGALPPHLQKENYQTLKSHLDNISIVTASLTDYLWQQPQDSYDKYSLSDFSSYTNPDKYERIWKGIIKTSRNGALVCERQFLVKRQLPLEVRAFVERDEGVEKKLESYDNSIFYSFVIARIYE